MHLTAADWEYVDERASGFSGRGWVFDRLAEHLSGRAGCLVISGPPGTGKTAISAAIVQRAAGRSPSSDPASATASFPVHAAYFCRDGRVDLLDCAQQLADQLMAALPAFAAAAQSALAAELKTGNVVVNVGGSVAPGGSVAGVRIVLDQLGPERAFSQGVALPLRRLRAQFDGQVVMLVDGLDETLARPETRMLPELLSKLEGIHLIVTTRRDRRVLQHFEDDAARLDLLDDAPPNVDDVVEYAYGRLGSVRDSTARAALAARIAAAAAGNFLYAQHVTTAIAAEPASAAMDRAAADALELPEGRLPGVYRAFIRREIGRDDTLWSTRYAPVLGPIAVSFGEGLTSTALAAVASEYRHSSFSLQDARDIARSCYQFLEGSRPDGPFRVYHKSFADFLVDPSDNPDYSVVSREVHRTIVTALKARPRSAWGWPSYEWRYLFRHAHAAGTTSDRFTELFGLADSGFLEESLAATGEPPAVAAGFELLFEVCAALDDVPRFASYARRRQSALRLQREITQTPGLMIARLDALAPEQRAGAAERMASAAALIPEALQRAQALLSFYRSASGDVAGMLTKLPRSIVDLVRGLPSSDAKSRLHQQLIVAVATCEPDRMSWLESCDLEPSIESVACADLAEGYSRSGDQASAFRLLRQAVTVAEDQGPFVTLEPDRLLAITSLLTDRAALEDLMKIAADKSAEERMRARALLMRVGLLAQLGRDAEAAALLGARLALLATRVRDADEEMKWQLALAVASTIQVLPYFMDDTIRRQLEDDILGIARTLPDTGRTRLATALVRAHALRLKAQRSDPRVAVDAVTRLLPLELGRHSDGRSIVIGLIQQCVQADHSGALLTLLERLADTTDYNDRAVCSAAAIVSLVGCGDATAARTWYDREAPREEAGSEIKPEARAAFGAAAQALGDSAAADSLVQRAFSDLSKLRDRPDAEWGLEALVSTSDLIADSMLRTTYYCDLMRVAATSASRTRVISSICLRARERSSRVEQLRLADAAEQALTQPRASVWSIAAIASSIRAFATAGGERDAAAALNIAFGWFRSVMDDADMPSMCDWLLRIRHPALDGDILRFLIREVSLAPSVYHGARALATIQLHSDGRFASESDGTLPILLDRVDREVEELNRMGALGLLAGSGNGTRGAWGLPLLERLDALIASGRPKSGRGSVSSSGWISARANCSLAYIASGIRDRALDILNDALDDELMGEWVEEADWHDRPTELVRAVLTLDADDASLPTLMRLQRIVERTQCAASGCARAIAQVVIGGADVPWEDHRALTLQPAARSLALDTAEKLLDIAKQQGFFGMDADVIRYSVVSAQAALARAYAEGDEPDRADALLAEAVESLADISDEQPRSWSLSALTRQCPDGLARRRGLEMLVRDAINTVGDSSNRSGLAQAFLESTPFDRIGRLSEWLGHLASQGSTNAFSQTAVALFQRGAVPDDAQYDLLRTAAIREPEDLLLVTAGIAEVATVKRRGEVLERLRELLALSGPNMATLAS